METSVILMNVTDQGAKDIKEFRGRYDLMVKAIEGAGGKVKGFYSCMGPYDYVMILEGLTAEDGMRLLMMNAMMGATRTLTMRAFPVDEFTAIVKKL
jgi:uncharacterized protein with GYD domain